MSVPAARVQLPGGAWHHGQCHRDAIVRAVTGGDEVFLLDSAELLVPAARVTALLARCVVQVGAITAEPPEDTVRGLSVGDREALLLYLRRLTFGDHIHCVLRCPACREPLESDLAVTELLLAPYTAPSEWYAAEVAEDGAVHDVRFRLPTGVDQEAVAATAAVDAPAAAAALLRRCVGEVRERASDRVLDDIPPAVAQRVGELLPELDPQAELTLDVACVACGHAFTVLFDVANYLFQELDARGGALYREVHTLALHYHWSEAEIMGMTSAKRWRYLDLIAESLAPRASA